MIFEIIYFIKNKYEQFGDKLIWFFWLPQHGANHDPYYMYLQSHYVWFRNDGAF